MTLVRYAPETAKKPLTNTRKSQAQGGGELETQLALLLTFR